MTRRDWDADRTCRGTGTWNIAEGHLGDAGYEGAEGCTSHHRSVSILRSIPFVSCTLICPLQLFALAENVALRKLQHIEIQPILRILGKELIIA